MKNLLTIVLFACICALVSAQGIKEKKVESSYLVYPQIKLEGMDINNIKVEFAHGSIKITDEKTTLKETNLCKAKGASLKDSKVLENFYYKIKYHSPQGIIRIKGDDGEVKYVTQTTEAATSYDLFGKNECYFMEMILESAYKKQKASNDSMLTANVYKDLYEDAQKFAKQSLSFYYQPENIEVHYLKDSKEFQYPELTKAADLAVEGYALIKDNYNNQSGINKLKEAIAIWEKEAATINADDRKARINKRSGGRILKNIAMAYAYIGDYNAAIDHIDKALALYPSTSNNSTVEWEGLKVRFYDLQKNAELNKGLKVSTAQSEVKVINLGIEGYADLKADLGEQNTDNMFTQIEAAKEKYNEDVAAGKVNKYEANVMHSATQGYMLTLPSMTGNLTSLADMQAAMKKLEEFPIEVCDLVKLNQLTLKNNKIQTIPADIKKLVNLKRLDLSKNQIEVLPAELGELKSLKNLVLKGNPLKAGEVDKIQELLPDCKIKM